MICPKVPVFRNPTIQAPYPTALWRGRNSGPPGQKWAGHGTLPSCIQPVKCSRKNHPCPGACNLLQSFDSPKSQQARGGSAGWPVHPVTAVTNVLCHLQRGFPKMTSPFLALPSQRESETQRDGPLQLSPRRALAKFLHAFSESKFPWGSC